MYPELSRNSLDVVASDFLQVDPVEVGKDVEVDPLCLKVHYLLVFFLARPFQSLFKHHHRIDPRDFLDDDGPQQFLYHFCHQEFLQTQGNFYSQLCRTFLES